jgi:chromosome segregation ATPase
MPDADIDDASSAELVVYTGPTADQPDPFRANAMTYYTPQTMIPPTPPSNHLQATSREEDVILSLRTQLALQQELCTQYEIDLGARDEIVQMLTARCEKTEKEGERRRGVLRTWKKKVGELEKVCRGLEEEVEKSREESWERSVMDEASGEALKCLQRRIETLEREKSEVEKNAQKVLEEKGGLEVVLEKFKEGLMDAKEQIQEGNDPEGMEDLKARLAQQEHTSIAERERHRMAEFEWEEERTELTSRRTQLETFKDELADELAAAQEHLTQKDHEYGILKGELKAQWKHTESASERMEEMRKEMDGIREEAAALEGRIGEMALEWNESESQRSDLESKLQEALSTKTTLETEKYEVGINICILIKSFTDSFICSSRNKFANNTNITNISQRLCRIATTVF